MQQHPSVRPYICYVLITACLFFATSGYLWHLAGCCGVFYLYIAASSTSFFFLMLVSSIAIVLVKMRRVGVKEIQQKEKNKCDQAQLEAKRKLEKFKDLLMMRSFRVIKFRECEEALEVAQAVSTLSNQKLGYQVDDHTKNLKSQQKLAIEPNVFNQNINLQFKHDISSFLNNESQVLTNNLKVNSEKSNRCFYGECINQKIALNNSRYHSNGIRNNYSVHPPGCNKKQNYDGRGNENYNFTKYNRRQFSEPVKSFSKPFENFDKQDVRFLANFYNVS